MEGEQINSSQQKKPAEEKAPLTYKVLTAKFGSKYQVSECRDPSL